MHDGYYNEYKNNNLDNFQFKLYGKGGNEYKNHEYCSRSRYSIMLDEESFSTERPSNTIERIFEARTFDKYIETISSLRNKYGKDVDVNEY